MTEQKHTIRNIESIAENEALDYALYTVENRAIPNMIDGLKPVQRFVLYEALKKCGNSNAFIKLASVASGVSDSGYHHGEVSAQEAGKLMANTWSNNFPILAGQGNFGSRLVQEGAAARYIFCKVHGNFDKVFKDSDIAPVHDDLEHKPPKYYLPIIPTVLLNGVRGIATGYSTNIHPYSVKSIIECVEEAIKKGKVSKTPEIEFPQFVGEIERLDDSKINLYGVYEWKSKTKLIISEVPYGFDREKYIDILDKLEDANQISYTDYCGEHGFKFEATIKKEFGLKTNEDEKHKQILDKFKLVQSSTEYIVVIDENGKLCDRDHFPNAQSLIEHFVKVRIAYIDKRIESNIEKAKAKSELARAKAAFIKLVIDEKIVIANKSRKEVMEVISGYKVLEPYAQTLISMNIYHITNDEFQKLMEEAKTAEEVVKYWLSTDSQVEYLNDLKELKKLIA